MVILNPNHLRAAGQVWFDYCWSCLDAAADQNTQSNISPNMVGVLSNTVDPGPYLVQVCQDTITYNTCISACGKAARKESLWLCPKILDHTLLADFVFGFVNWLLFLFSVVCCNFDDSPFWFYMEESVRLWWIDMLQTLICLKMASSWWMPRYLH